MRYSQRLRRHPKARELASNLAQGYNVEKTLKAFPEIAEAYQLYSLCRSQMIVHARIPKGNDEMIKNVLFTTGLTVLPKAGGVLDQPARLMTFFDAFMAGDQQAFSINLKK